MPQKAQWTVLTFIAAHNDLEAFGKRSLMEILDVGSTTDVVLGAFFDGKTGAGLYTMGIDSPGKVEHQEMLGQYDSGDPAGVVAAARWLFEKYPAERYALVLWSHGNGWQPAEMEAVAREARPADPLSPTERQERSAAPGRRVLFRTTLRAMLEPAKPQERAILFDDGTGHSLDTLELGRAIAEIAAIIQQPLDVLGMDACLMANAEVAYQLRDHAKYLVASQELVPGHSWPYPSLYGALRADARQDAAQFARRIVDEYVSHYTANPPAAGDVTQVALDLSKVGVLAGALDGFATALLADIGTNADRLADSQIHVRNVESRKGARQPNKFSYHLFDVATLARRIAAGAGAPLRAAADALVAALQPGAGPVLAEGHRGEWFDGLGGVTVYLPQARVQGSRWYDDLDFAKATRWPRLLSEYRAHYPPGDG
jgi:hypothetical protein